MKSKEEIITEVLDKQKIVKYREYFKKAMSAAMEEYAQQFAAPQPQKDYVITGGHVVKSQPTADAVEFGKWLKHLDNGDTHYDPDTKQHSDSIGFSPFDCFTDDTKSVEWLYQQFKASTPIAEVRDNDDCKHEGMVDTGSGYYHCPSCNKSLTYDEWEWYKFKRGPSNIP